MLLSMMLSLVSCVGDDNGDDTGELGGGEVGGGSTDDGGNTGDGGNNNGTTDPEPDPEPEPPYKVIENYFPADISTALYANFIERSSANGYDALSKANGPFAYLDTAVISDCRILSVTVPVMRVSAAVEFTHKLTFYKVKSSAKGLNKAPIETYEVLLNAFEYDLPIEQTKNVYKVIEIDLSGFNIVLGKGETLAFMGENDTIMPAYIKDNSEYPMGQVIKNRFPEAYGAFFKVGDTAQTSFLTSTYMLCMDIKLERTYENESTYNALVAKETQYSNAIEALKALYKGKTISILGDSISTYEGYSNDSKANSTTKGHAVYYPKYENSLLGYQSTYWGRLMTDLNMSLCVNNSWGGGRVMGKSATNYLDRMTYRATELDRDDGTKPDVIISYMGINDVHDSSLDLGRLYSILENKADKRSEREKIAEWFSALLQKAGDMPYQRLSNGVGYSSFDEAYALGILTMKTKYPEAEIYCMTMLFNYSDNMQGTRLNQANRVIIALCNFFGVTAVDQSGEFSAITNDNVHCYGTLNGTDCVHPNSRGHELIERTILLTMAKKNGLI